MSETETINLDKSYISFFMVLITVKNIKSKKKKNLLIIIY